MARRVKPDVGGFACQALDDAAGSGLVAVARLAEDDLRPSSQAPALHGSRYAQIPSSPVQSMSGLDGSRVQSYLQRVMDGDASSPPLPDPPPVRRKVVERDAPRISAEERDALLDRIEDEIAEIDERAEPDGRM